ncbi:MAG: MmcQ/YjbR family DNA-binding protein [Dehalococcoidia bacterium]
MAAESSLPRTLALARVRAICMAMPGAVEKEAWGQPTWRAGEKGKMFAQPTHLARAITVPSDATEQAVLVETDPERFFIPPYSGANGWVGLHLDEETDWEQAAALLVAAYRRVAPRKMALLAESPSFEPAALAAHALATATVDAAGEARIEELAASASQAFAELGRLCLPLPGVEARPGHHGSFAVAGKNFVYVLNDHHGDDMISVQAKVPPGVQEILVSADPARFSIPPYMGKAGWVAVRVDRGYVDWEEIGGLVLDSYRLVAPRKLVQQANLPPRA